MKQTNAGVYDVSSETVELYTRQQQNKRVKVGVHDPTTGTRQRASWESSHAKLMSSRTPDEKNVTTHGGGSVMVWGCLLLHHLNDFITHRTRNSVRNNQLLGLEEIFLKTGPGRFGPILFSQQTELGLKTDTGTQTVVTVASSLTA